MEQGELTGVPPDSLQDAYDPIAVATRLGELMAWVRMYLTDCASREQLAAALEKSERAA